MTMHLPGSGIACFGRVEFFPADTEAVAIVLLFALGMLSGAAVAAWVDRMSRRERQLLNWPALPAGLQVRRRWLLIGVTALLFAGLTWAEFPGRALETPEVQPSWNGRQVRLVYHLVLVTLLIAATAIDFDCYVIPDQITLPGILIGLAGAVAVGELQICHLWVDWHLAIPHLRGPGIPGWYDTCRHWHGLAWSAAGLVAASLITALARWLSSLVLGQEAMGFGDVTLMAMIGSFVGWQAGVLIFLLAPVIGLAVGVPILLASGRTFLPYGPWLSLAAVFVLFRWGWLWETTRLIFSDAVGMTILAGAGSGGLVVLLLLVRLYRAIPGRTPTA